MKRVSILELTPEEQTKFAAILKDYFPELGTDEEMEGGDTVEQLCYLYSALPQVEIEE